MRFQQKITSLLEQAKNQSDIDKKRGFYIKALRVSQLNKDLAYRVQIYANLISIYFHKDLYSKALYYINLGKKYYRKSNNFFYFISARATVYIYNNQLYEARKVLLCFYREENLIMFAETYNQLSEIALREDKVSKAIYYAKKSLDILEDDYELGKAYFNLIDLYRQKKMFDEAFYFLEKAEKLNILEEIHLNFLKYNILVQQGKYKEAEIILPLVEKELDNFPEFINIFMAITLELFKQTNNKKRFLVVFNKTKALNRNEIAMLWLIYDQAGNFYHKRGEQRKALKYYKLSAIYLEKHRKKSNLKSEDKLNFFRDKYYYLLDYSLFSYNNKKILDAFCFLELSKSSSLRDAIFVESLKYDNIKDYM